MILDEYIETLRKHSKCDVSKCIKFNCSECDFSISMEQVPTDSEILSYFEELKVTRKALVLACESFNGSNCPVHKFCPIDKDCKDCCADYFIQKARENV